MEKILVTGGLGYIGSHTCVELIQENFNVIIIDNLCNCNKSVVQKIQEITGSVIDFVECDVRNYEQLDNVFKTNKIAAILHFAGLKSVLESCENPLKYYDNNVCGTVNLCGIAKKYGVNNIVFSSSATVYGDNTAPLLETMAPKNIANPYGHTKLMIENILCNLHKSDNSWNIIALRYFNPVGAHKSGKIGENPLDLPNNIMPIISRTARGILRKMEVFGNDYNTPDGTCIRDFVHVVDLAKAHVNALKKIFSENVGFEICNVGNGNGISVLELIKKFEEVNDCKVNFNVGARRKGDLPVSFADISKAKTFLNWTPKHTVDDMCLDEWHWQINESST